MPMPFQVATEWAPVPFASLLCVIVSLSYDIVKKNFNSCEFWKACAEFILGVEGASLRDDFYVEHNRGLDGLRYQLLFPTVEEENLREDECDKNCE